MGREFSESDEKVPMKYYTFLILHFTFYMVLVCCGNKTQRAYMSDTIPMQPCPRFEAERAMQSIVAQCDFGPRVPGTEAWQQCGDYIVSQFEGMGLAVEQQTTTVVAYDGSKLPCRNIIASLHPNNPDRILLCAHWDSRPWADNDSDERNHKATYVSVFGAEEAKRLAEVYTQNAISALDYFGDRADDVRSFAALLLKRQK